MLSYLRDNKAKHKTKEKAFLNNGAAVLEQLLKSFNGNCNPIRMYSIKELNEATHNFQFDGLICRDALYSMYKGFYRDHQVLVKEFLSHRRVGHLELIANEVAIASQMSKHKNVLKLLGCSLESELPMLVYEFPAKGNLSSYVDGDGEKLPWESKLKIANELANAIAYLHHGLSKTIIHRDIKCGHMFLDEEFVPKLSEFQVALPIPEGKTHVEADVFSTQGVIAPELFLKGRYTKMSDAFSFGILVCEVLTGKKRCDMECADQVQEAGTWEETFIAKLCETCLEANVLEEEKRVQVMECAKLLESCLKENPDRRPNMIQVAKSLRYIRTI
ncbi:hypothetical protein UlMin_016149 [Ulmus minor]